MDTQHILDNAIDLLNQVLMFPDKILGSIPESERTVISAQLQTAIAKMDHANDDATLLHATHAFLTMVEQTPALQQLDLLGSRSRPMDFDHRQRTTEIARYLSLHTATRPTTYCDQYQTHLSNILPQVQHELERFSLSSAVTGIDQSPSYQGATMSNGHLSQIEFADNPEPRCPVILVLDTSESMNEGGRIRQLNEGLRTLQTEVKKDQLAVLRVEIAIITFGGTVQVMNGRENSMGVVPFDADRAFVGAYQFEPPILHAAGSTPMGQAARQALTLIRERKTIYQNNSIDYYRPWLFFITDGEPNDHGWEQAAAQVRTEDAKKGVLSFAIGVEGANLDKLAQFSTRSPKKLRGLAFREFFQWLSNSLSRVSESAINDKVKLQTTDDWAEV